MDRYFRVKNFVPETFWAIKVMHKREGIEVNFNWSRHRLFDQVSAIVLFERCLAAKAARVTKVEEKPTKKWKPLPLTTVEFQKMATRFLQMTGQRAMTVAEALYNKGFISYPRTETDRFDKGMNLRALVEKQTQDQRWGPFAQNLVDGAFQQPRQGRHDDKAHPPIHPVIYAAPTVLDHDEKRVYELVVRRFLACCSEDAKGMATDVTIQYGDESFNAHGVIVLERNYLDVYPYENWTGTVELPKFTVGERFEPTEAMITEGKTSAPSYLSEADLIALMDANGIGTDATMAEHIEKIQERQYARTVDRGGRGANQDAEDGEEANNAPPARGGRGGNRGGRGGRGGGRGGRGGTAGSGRRGVREFIPTSLGVALIEGFDRMHFETSLGKPFLRKEMELQMKAICEGRATRQTVLHQSLTKYRQVFDQSKQEVNLLKAVGWSLCEFYSLPAQASVPSLTQSTGMQTICLQQRGTLMGKQLRAGGVATGTPPLVSLRSGQELHARASFWPNNSPSPTTKQTAHSSRRGGTIRQYASCHPNEAFTMMLACVLCCALLCCVSRRTKYIRVHTYINEFTVVLCALPYA